jgi:hypothetical protein
MTCLHWPGGVGSGPDIRVRQSNWDVLPETVKGTIVLCLLVSLVTCAAMMPVSVVFDHVPLTAVALRRGGYDRGFPKFAVGFGGSMICRLLQSAWRLPYVSRNKVSRALATASLARRRGLSHWVLHRTAEARLAS